MFPSQFSEIQNQTITIGMVYKVLAPQEKNTLQDMCSSVI